MYTHFKTIGKLIFVFFILSHCFRLYGQITITTLVTPPYRSTLSEYANQVKITLRSNTATRVAMSVKITGDNGIVMQTANPNALGFFSLEANVPFFVPAPDLFSYFDPGFMQVTGITSEQVSQYGLPVGSYRICVTLLRDGVPITNNSQGCSNTFRVAPLQAPQIITPICGSNQYKGGVQNLFFSWTPTPFTGGISPIKYKLRIIEIKNENFSPTEAMQSATSPDFFVEDDIQGNSFLYGPDKPLLDLGKRYAFEIIAYEDKTNDRNLNLNFNNQGRSQVCYFIYGAEDTTKNSLLAEKNNKPKSKKKEAFATQFPGIAFSPAHIEGTLYYQYAGPLPNPGTIKDNQNQLINKEQLQLKNKPLLGNETKNASKTIVVNNQSLVFSDMSASLLSNKISFLSTDNRNKEASWPLPNMPFKLVVKYMIYDWAANKRKTLSAYEVQTSNIPKNKIKYQPDQVLASGYTDKDGKFSLTFLLKDSLGLLLQNTSITVGSGEFHTTYKGNFYCVLRLIVDSKHYCSPGHDIIVNPFESATFDNLYALLKTYGLTVKTVSGNSDNMLQGPFEGLDVFILRKTVPYDIPMDEGLPNTPKEGSTLSEYPTLKVIAHSKTDKNGDAKFNHLVKNLTGYDKYYIYVNSESSENLNFRSLAKEYKNLRKDEGSTNLEIPESAVYNNEYVYESDYISKINIIALPPNITGLVKQSNGKSINEGDVGLFNLGIGFPLKVLETQTNDEGRYWFKNIYKIYYTNNNQKVDIPYAVKASKAGYKDKTKAVAGGSGLKYGQKVKVETIFLDPKSMIGGKIIDAKTKTGVQCNVTVIGGSSVLSDPPLLTISGGSKTTDKNSIQQSDLIQIQNLASQFDAVSGNDSKSEVFQITGINKSPTISANSTPSTISNVDLVNMQLGPSYFSLPAPSGLQKIKVDPVNNNYFTDTLEVNLKNGLNVLNIEVLPKIHRIKLNVTEAKPSGYIVQFVKGNSNKPPKIIKAKVRVVGRTDFELTNEIGEVKLEFGGSDNFDIEVIPPDDLDYESTIKSFTGILPGKSYTNLNVSLKKASRISGKVTFEGAPVEGATVKLNYPGKKLETSTNADGSYTLKGLPLGNNILIQATKENFIGDTSVISVTSEWKNNINFELSKFTDLDLSKLLGFPIQVASIKKENGKTYITGEFSNLPRNGQIETEDEKQGFKFTNLEISAGSVIGMGGLPYPVPVSLPIKTDLNTVSVILNGIFSGDLEDKMNGIIIDKALSETSGTIKGLLKVNTDKSFLSNMVSFGTDKIYLKDASKNGAVTPIIAINSEGEKPFGDSNELFVCNQDGKNIHFTIYGFKAEADANISKFSGNRLKLNSILHTQLKNVGNSDLAVKVGDIDLLHNGISPLSKTTPLNIPLEKWTLSVSKWSLTNNGFVLNEGKIKTHLANINFTNIEIDPVVQELKYGAFNLSTLDLKGITTLNVTGNANFFFEAGHWVLAITPKNGSCGYIPALPGMPVNQNLSVSSVFIKSNNSGDFSVVTKPFKLFNVVDYNPTSLSVYDDRIEMPGAVNFNIPDIPAHVGLIKYRRLGSAIEYGFQPFSFGFKTKGVDLHFNLEPNSIGPSGLTAKGTLSEPGLYSVNVQLNKTANKTEIVDLPGQSFPIDKTGKRKLTDFDGEMHVASDKWTHFVFSGDLNGTKGASGRLTFTVKGDIIADGQSVKVDKINTPFGNMSYTFDFANSRLTGKLQINQLLNGTGELLGAAESVIDQDGWYFCAGGKLTMKNNPYFKQMSSAILFGDYPAINDPFITKTFADFSYSKTLPASFKQNLSGFYASGAAEFPVPYVPDIDVDLVVVSGELSVSVGGGFDLGMNFNDAGLTLFTGSNVFVHGHIGIGGSVGIACAGASFDAQVDFANFGELKSNGDWYIEGINTLTLSGGAYSGYGCCNSKCNRCSKYSPVGCHKDKWGGNKSFKFKMHMGSDANYIDVSW